MKDFYPASPFMTPLEEKNGTQTPIFLAAEQILVQQTPRNVKKEHNAVIRLAASIEKYGILEPLFVKISPQPDGYALYELIDGERRFRAAALAGVRKLPCLVLAPNDKKCIKIAAIKAVLREKLHFFALAEAFSNLIEQYQMTQEEIADRMGLSQSAVANKLRLLQFTPEERRLIVSGTLTERHARTFLRLKDPEKRREIIEITLREGYNVAKTEELVQKWVKSPKRTHAQNPTRIPEEQESILPATLPFWEDSTGESGEKRVFNDENAVFEPKTPLKTPESPKRNVGVTPKKFALRDLQPLYNSIERTLGIFEKTGVSVEYTKHEDENCAHIAIRIPK
ncbi:MAG: ParB/RepB/Spo0J family partition protein [Clostridia bacterium]|nr:ParB/RepB/Spo0J family partition protein [Clostridia bacterium]